ncbi:VWA domain-containing protein [Thermopolyspora sp. NPDC052614]|uniref:vWA domain-containing protein n=1 Tax=Thermopolyspora sp. NPDC052614 TaxID=3155682 RepID=UPI00343D816D
MRRSPNGTTTPGGLLANVDRAALAVAFAERLRRRGVPVGLPAVEAFVRAMEVSPPDSMPRLYWAARIALVRHRSEIEIFDAVFAAVFGDVTLGVDPHARRRRRPLPPAATGRYITAPGTAGANQQGGGLPWATPPRVIGDAEPSDSPLTVPEPLPSAVAALADTPFEHLDDHELDLLATWLRSAMTDWPTRRSRRFTPDPRGRRIALRATIARSRRTGWEPLRLMRERPARRPRRLVMLCDVSQSMRPNVTAYLHLMRALALFADAETFAFATTLTRLTAALRHRSTRLAIEHASEKVTDRYGGTRIATNIAALLASHHGGLVRGAVVIIASDGWDSDPPEAMTAAMTRLRRRAHRVIWLNPRAAAPGFEPRVGAMAAALPYCDNMLPADTFHALRRVIEVVADIR